MVEHPKSGARAPHDRSQFPSVLLVAVRSQTVEANVVVAHNPVEGHEHAENWWETLSEFLLSFDNDAPTYVCIDANGRLGSSTSKHVGSLSADLETPNGERLHRFLWERTSAL